MKRLGALDFGHGLFDFFGEVTDTFLFDHQIVFNFQININNVKRKMLQQSK